MAAGTPEQTHYKLVETPDPNERGFILWVREHYFTATTSTPLGTTLTDFMSTENIPKGDLVDKGFGSYVYTRALPKQGSCLLFAFAKNKTQADLETPYVSYDNFEDFTWPAVLEVLRAGRGTYIEEDTQGTVGTNDTRARMTKAVLADRYVLIPKTTAKCRFLYEEWFSPTPFTDLFAETINTTIVSYSYNGINNSFDCLHGDIFIPEIFEDFEYFPSWGTEGADSLPAGMFFPATVPFTTWTNHIISDTQTFEQTGWRRRRVSVEPPPMPEGIRIA